MLFRLALATSLLSGAALAAPVTYTSRIAFEAALGTALVTEGFESVPASLRGTNLPDEDPGARYGATIGGVTLSSPQAFGVQYVSGSTQLFTRFSNSTVAASRVLTVTLPGQAFAFGIDLVDYQSPDTAGTDPLTISGLGVTQSLDTSPAPGAPSFFGVIDRAATTGSFAVTRDLRVVYPLTFDNISFALSPTRVPEPGSMLVVAMGLFVLAWMRRRA